MPIKKSIVLSLAGSLLLLGATFLSSQTQGAPTKKVRAVPIDYVSPADGPQMYKDYCAACHGMEGRGNGPAADFLKVPPPDLTTLTQRNQGKYPALKVDATMRFGSGSSHAHGSLDMPVWGRLFSEQWMGEDNNTAQMRFSNLNAHLKSLQRK